MHLIVDDVFVARQIVPGAQNADGSGEAGACLHVRKQESVGGPRVVRVMNDQVGFRDAIAERHDFDVAIGLAADALVAILAEDEGLAVLELEYVFAARFFFRQAGPRAIIKDIAVLQNLDERGASMRCRGFQRVLQVRLENVHGARHKRGFRANGQ